MLCEEVETGFAKALGLKLNIAYQNACRLFAFRNGGVHLSDNCKFVRAVLVNLILCYWLTIRKWLLFLTCSTIKLSINRQLSSSFPNWLLCDVAAIIGCSSATNKLLLTHKDSWRRHFWHPLFLQLPRSRDKMCNCERGRVNWLSTRYVHTKLLF